MTMALDEAHELAMKLRETAAALTALADKLVGQPRVVTEGKTPHEWVELLASHGIAVSERTLRERARALGAFNSLGNTMILLPEHIDAVFEQPSPL